MILNHIKIAMDMTNPKHKEGDTVRTKRGTGTVKKKSWLAKACSWVYQITPTYASNKSETWIVPEKDLSE